MMTLADRIKKIRKAKNLKQAELGEILGVKEATVTSWETGARNPAESVLVAMCREFNVNEEWLNTGEGDMFKPVTRSEKIATFAGDLMKDESDSFRRQLVEVLADLDEKEWEVLAGIAEKLVKKGGD